MSTHQVAVLQLNSQDNVTENLQSVTKLVEKARNAGAELIVLPENFAYLGHESGKFAIAESLHDNGPILMACRNLAKHYQCELILGGFPEKSPNPQKVFNSCIHLTREGEVAAIYRKMHLFDVALDANHTFCESATVAAGNEIVIAETSIGKVGLSICYDLRFPELYRELTLRGATTIVVPAAFTYKTGEAHWEVLLRSRAIENQVYILAAAQVGSHPGNRRTYGHAMIIDPWGEILAQCESEAIGFRLATIDSDFQQQIRQQLPCLAHRRIA